MALDSALVNSIQEICREIGQPESVSKRLLAWLKESSEKQLSVSEENQYLELLRQAVVIADDDDL
jgi:hypothetical protein